VPQPADVAHLLRRAGFTADPALVATLAPQSLDAIVDQLLDTSAAPADTAPSFLTEDIGDWEKEYRLLQWWIDRMRTSPVPLQEKMTLFWHGHFATENAKVADMRLMYQQNALFRSMAFGNFRELVRQMSVQPAMLLYLDNAYNRRGSPNENFARELMELFTLGVNQYTQDDVVAAARAWTGHNVLDNDRTVYNFYSSRHDTGQKTFMGVTRNWDGPGTDHNGNVVGPSMIDYLLAEDLAKKTIAARFIATKVWAFFAYPSPPTSVVDDLTAAFLAADLDVAALLRAMFLHTDFYSAAARQGHVRSPVEWLVSALQVFGPALTAAQAHPEWWVEDMGQYLFEPPNVAGWELNGYWLPTTSMWARANWARYVTWRVRNLNSAFLNNTRPPTTVPDAISIAFDAFRIDTPSAGTRARLEGWLTQQRTIASGSTAVANLITLMLLTPDFTVA
jgi:uncharacterized protein (DUF1800 family)